MRKSGASSAESAIQDERAGELRRDHHQGRREGDPDRAGRAAAAPENDGERRRVGGLQKKLRHEPGIAPDDAPLLDAQRRAGACAEARRSPRCDPRMSRRARRGDRRAREALAEKDAGERKDDGAESCPDENRLRVARRRAHRAPTGGLAAPPAAFAGGARAARSPFACPRAAWRQPAPRAPRTRRPRSPRSGRRGARGAGLPPKTGPSPERPRSPFPRARPQSRPDRARANADGPCRAATSASGASKRPDRCDGPDRNRQSAGGKQGVSVDGRSEDQLEVRAPEQRAGKVGDRLADDPGKDERGAAGENRRDPRDAVGTVLDADEPAGDRVGRDMERHEQKRDQNRQSSQRQRAEHRRQARARSGADRARRNEEKRPGRSAIMRRVRPQRSNRGTPSPASRRPRRRWRATHRASLRRSSAHAR